MNATPPNQTDYPPTPDPTRPIQKSGSGRHPLHVGYLVMGLAFLGLVGIWAAVEWDFVPTEDVRWLLPLPWVFAGAAGLLAVVFSGRSRASDPTPTAHALNETTTLDKEL